MIARVTLIFLLDGKMKKYTSSQIKGRRTSHYHVERIRPGFPMDIYPEYLIKAILAFDIDKWKNLGIYEARPRKILLFANLSDTSKLELQKIVRDGLDRLMKEMN